ncbi:UvrD-helicase domain-containing protein [Lichenihabitans psoromatis]|uniref:UvrD-helicase domain-containing protein n=1 Tax=Lichenihabitans psoromatis TaxID=2528642 RepID=UPI0010383E26|nr:UvrD-helicase domain-containing protein [Lichenihabitans psoromatis]
MIGENRLVIAAAGSGKTTYIVDEAVKIRDQRVLITTYTDSNEAEIRQKFFDVVGHVPSNVVIMTWFSLLITHGVKPFQGGVFDFPIKGMVLVQAQSAIRYINSQGIGVPWPEDDAANHFFDSRGQVFSDKLSKLVIRCNEQSGGAVFDRLSRIFPHVFIDEVQDLAGYDLDILEALARSPVRLLMVGDPRQVTYLTHNERRLAKYANGGIADFLRTLSKKLKIKVDDSSLNRSHRNSAAICAVSSRLFPDFAATQACECSSCRRPPPANAGVFMLRISDYAHYLAIVRPMQLRDRITSSGIDPSLPALNFGESKGRGFDHVVILPTGPMKKWLADPDSELAAQSRAKFYVALTRARYSVAIAIDWKAAALPAGFSLYEVPVA